MRPGKKFLQSSELLWGEGLSVPPLQTVKSDSLENISTGGSMFYPLKGAPTLQEGAPTYDFAKISKKKCIIESSRGRPG